MHKLEGYYIKNTAWSMYKNPFYSYFTEHMSVSGINDFYSVAFLL